MQKFISISGFSGFSGFSVFSIFLAICLSACSGGKVEDKYPGQPVKHRQESFKNILNAFEPLGLMRRGERKFDASTFQNSLQNLEKYSQSDELLWKYFDKNLPTTDAPSRSKTAIWEDFSAFENSINDYKNAVKNFAEVVAKNSEETQNFEKTGIQNAYDEVHQQCRNCHKKFRK